LKRYNYRRSNPELQKKRHIHAILPKLSSRYHLKNQNKGALALENVQLLAHTHAGLFVVKGRIPTTENGKIGSK
jgi:hypothetical protein